MSYLVTSIQATEPEALEVVAGIRVEVEPELDSMGLNTVTIIGPTRNAVIDYVRSQWGDDDPDWLAEWVVARIEKVEDVKLSQREREDVEALDEGQTRGYRYLRESSIPHATALWVVRQSDDERRESLNAVASTHKKAASEELFAARVEVAWNARTNGELAITTGTEDDPEIHYDRELRDVVDALAAYARTNIEQTASAQFDAAGDELEDGRVDDEELASRIAAALELTLWGGKR